MIEEGDAMLMLSESAHETTDCQDTLAADRAAQMERRRGLRVRQARPVKIFDAVAARYFGGQTEDISGTGLRVELPRYVPIEPGDTLTVHVGLNRAGHTLANHRQMMPARVVWVNRQDHRINGKLEAGIEFVAGISAHLDAA